MIVKILGIEGVKEEIGKTMDIGKILTIRIVWKHARAELYQAQINFSYLQLARYKLAYAVANYYTSLCLLGYINLLFLWEVGWINWE